MRKSYLFIFSDRVGTRAEVQKVIDNMPEVITWRFELNSFFLVSESSATELSKSFKEETNHESGKFLITQITGNKQGWLSSRAWHVINKKKLKPKED